MIWRSVSLLNAWLSITVKLKEMTLFTFRSNCWRILHCWMILYSSKKFIPCPVDLDVLVSYFRFQSYTGIRALMWCCFQHILLGSFLLSSFMLEICVVLLNIQSTDVFLKYIIGLDQKNRFKYVKFNPISSSLCSTGFYSLLDLWWTAGVFL